MQSYDFHVFEGEPPEPVEYEATCRTEGCGNENIVITDVWADADYPTVICGVCFQQVTDLVRVTR